MPRATATERLARRPVAELAAVAGRSEAAADFAAAQVWVEHRMHSLLLREPGRNVPNRERRP
jgi:hypothetical protein